MRGINGGVFTIHDTNTLYIHWKWVNATLDFMRCASLVEMEMMRVLPVITLISFDEHE